MECLLEEYLPMKVKGLPDLDSLKMPHILLNVVFPIDVFYGFSLSGYFLSSSVPLAKIDKETNYANSSPISSLLL